MKKITIAAITVSIVGVGVGATALYLYKKKKTTPQTVEEDMVCNEDSVHDTMNATDDAAAAMCIESNDDEIDDNGDVCGVIYEENTFIDEYNEFLINNGVQPDEASAITDLIRTIQVECPDDYHHVEQRMLDMIKTGYDLKQSQAFDADNFRMLYGSIDPKRLFTMNAFKIVSMGPDCQLAMNALADGLVGLKLTNMEYYLECIAPIVYAFRMPHECFTPELYESVFRQYVDQLGVKITNTDNIKNVEGDGNK